MKTVLSVSSLAKRYGAVEALVEVSFELIAGQIVAVLGPNGAGKTTLLSILAGVQPQSTGGFSADAKIGWAPQQPALYSKLTVTENLELFARLEKVSDPASAVARMLQQSGLAERAHELVGRLSGGNRQRVNVALGLIADPPVLALDEPSASLDPAQRERLWQFIATLAQAGTAVIFSSHNVAEAQRHADRVLVLAEGRLLLDGTPRELLRAGEQDEGGDLERALVRFLELRGSPQRGAGA